MKKRPGEKGEGWSEGCHCSREKEKGLVGVLSAWPRVKFESEDCWNRRALSGAAGGKTQTCR